MSVTNPYASTDPAVLTFIAAQNASAGRGTSGTFAPALENNGIAGSTTDNVIGFSSLTASLGTIAMGSGFNTVIIDGAHSVDAGASADNFTFSVDSTGNLVLTDSNTLKTVTLSGVSNLIFQGAATGTDAHGNSDYASMFYIGNSNQSEIVRLYQGAFGRQPDLGGVEYYTNQLNSLTFQQIASEFQAAPEYQARYGANVSDTAFITTLYQNILGRMPSQSDTAYYLSALQNNENGLAATATNPSWTRAQELLNFSNSAENQTNVAGFSINTAGTASNGLTYADTAPASQNATQILTAGLASGTIDTALIDTATATGTLDVGGGYAKGGVTLNADAYGQKQILSGKPGLTIDMSNTIRNVHIENATGDTVYGAAGASSDLVYFSQNGGTVYYVGSPTQYHFLQGVNNQPAGTVPTPLEVHGSSTTTYLLYFPQPKSGTPVFLATPPAGTTIQGVNLSQTSTTFIDVGAVSDDKAATMATAAAKVFTPITSAQAVANNLQYYQQVVFFGHGSNNDTVIYEWQQDSTHQVSASTMLLGIDLIGLASSKLATMNITA